MQSREIQSPVDINSVVGIVPLLITEICLVSVEPAASSPHSIEVKSVLEPTSVTFNPITTMRSLESIFPR